MGVTAKCAKQTRGPAKRSRRLAGNETTRSSRRPFDGPVNPIRKRSPEMIWTIAQVLIGAALAYLGFIFIYEFLTTRLRNWSDEGSRAYIYCQQSETEYRSEERRVGKGVKSM